jgi:DnaJ-domain-containing protein 1
MDEDYQEAWEELNSYMRKGEEEAKTHYKNEEKKPRSPLNSLKRDYANLEVPFGSSFDMVKKAYKRLLVQYHPDRYANNPEKLQTATEIVKKINDSYMRIKQFHQNQQQA